MSSGDSDAGDAAGSGEPAPVKKALRTVTPPYRGRPDSEMTLVGIAYFLGLLVVLVPLLPFLAVVWLFSKITGAVANRAPTDRLPGGRSR